MTEKQTGSATHEPEVFSRTVEVMKKMHAEQVFTTPQASKAFLDSLTYDEFASFLDTVNGAERQLPHSARGMRGESGIGFHGVSSHYIPPENSMRPLLMREAFEQAKMMESPVEAGMMLGMTIGAIHPYGDGNGRTSRLVFALLAKGYTGSQEDIDLYSRLLLSTEEQGLSNHRSGKHLIDANPAKYRVMQFIAGEMRKEAAQQAGYEAGEPIPAYTFNGADDSSEDIVYGDVATRLGDDHQRQLNRVITDDGFAVIAFMQALGRERVALHTHTIKEEDRSFVVLDTLVPTLTADDIEALNGYASSNKLEYVRRLIKIFDHDSFRNHFYKTILPSNPMLHLESVNT